MSNRIVIPERHHDTVRLFLDMSEEEREKLLLSLTSSEEIVSIKKLKEKINKETNIPEEQLKRILDFLKSLSSLKEFERLDAKELVENVIEFINENNLFEKKPYETLKDQLIKFLSNDNSLTLSAKAISLLFSREKLLTGSKIITDVRPVFSPINNEIKTNIIIHNIKIDFIEGSQKKEIYLALDKKDLKKLKENIIRAEKKEDWIAKSYSEKGLHIMSLE